MRKLKLDSITQELSFEWNGIQNHHNHLYKFKYVNYLAVPYTL